PWKKLRMITRLKALTATGMINDHSESSRPSLVTTMKVGIMPPLKSMVKMTRKLMVRRPGRRGFDSAYAIKDVRIRLSSVPAHVTNVETPRARKIVGVERM